MSKLLLPKEHLSFSQIELWLKSPDTYRRKYYGGASFATTPAMEFGNKVTLAMAANEPWVSFIPRYPLFERELLVEVEGIPIKAAVDNMNPANNQFCEQKTGKTPWTQNKVNKHLQLDIYSTLLEIVDGYVTDECYLIWVETQNVEKKVVFNGIELEGTSTEIALTGKFTLFPRIITKDDRRRCRELILRVGREIAEDFAAYKHLYAPKENTA